MKKQLFAAITSIATMVASTPAWADGDNLAADTTVLSVAGVNPPKCNLTSSSTVVTLANNSVSNNDGFAVNNVGAQIANALNNLNVNAWCTGASNTVTLARTSLARDGSNGAKTSGGFNQAIIYDISMSIAGVGGAGGNNGNANGNGNGNGGGNGNGNNGCGNGNGGGNGANCGGGSITTAGGVGSTTASRFGPTNAGSAVTFAGEGSSNATSVGGTGTGARTLFTSDAARLAAGTYSGTVTVTISPGG